MDNASSRASAMRGSSGRERGGEWGEVPEFTWGTRGEQGRFLSKVKSRRLIDRNWNRENSASSPALPAAILLRPERRGSSRILVSCSTGSADPFARNEDGRGAEAP